MCLIGISHAGALRSLCLDDSRMGRSVPATKGCNDKPDDTGSFDMCNVQIRIPKKLKLTFSSRRL